MTGTVSGEYQILIDPVLEQWDGLAGKLAKYTAIEAPNAKSPLTAEDLRFVIGSENPRKNSIVVVAISHDHLDHFNFRTLKKLPENTRYYVPHGLESEFPYASLKPYSRHVPGLLTQILLLR